MKKRSIFVYFLLSFAFLFILNFFIVKGDAVIWMNQQYSFWLNEFFRYATYLGDGLIFLPIILIGLFIRYEISITAAVTGIILGLVIGILKRQIFTEFKRPRSFLDGVYDLNFVDGVDVHSHFSFPSGHTASAASVAVILALYIRKPFWVAFMAIAAIIVGLSRVYLAQHFWVDITYGYLTGIVVGFMSYRLTDGWLNSKRWAQKNLLMLFKQK